MEEKKEWKRPDGSLAYKKIVKRWLLEDSCFAKLSQVEKNYFSISAILVRYPRCSDPDAGFVVGGTLALSIYLSIAHPSKVEMI